MTTDTLKLLKNKIQNRAAGIPTNARSLSTVYDVQGGDKMRFSTSNFFNYKT